MDDNNAGHRDRLRQKSTDKGLEALTDLDVCLDALALSV